jgi:hypothetical protein
MGLGLAWAIAAVVGSTLGVLVGGAIGGAIAGSGVYAALADPPLAHMPSRSRVIVAWSIATVIGQVILRGIGDSIGHGSLGTCVWIAAAIASGGASGALGLRAMGLTLDKAGTHSYPFAPAKLPAGLLVGGFPAGLVITYYPLVLDGMFGYVSGFMVRLGMAFFVAGVAMGLIGALVASRRPPPS